MLTNFTTISEAINYCRELLKNYGEVVATESWQGIKRETKMYEYLNIYWAAQMPNDLKTLRNQIQPQLPWADVHFEERVGGQPLNPGESYKIWPHYKDTKFNDQNFRNVGVTNDGKDSIFSHTYMERYWPKDAGDGYFEAEKVDGSTKGDARAIWKGFNEKPLKGIRYLYGDLKDVINLLGKEPFTRQAYLPVWFPEDTGVLHGGRVPCTLGYHFIMRHNKLHIHYTIRACDYLRHFRNDIYLTCRLLFWVLQQLKDNIEGYLWHDVQPGLITMDIVSLHVFEQERNLI